MFLTTFLLVFGDCELLNFNYFDKQELLCVYAAGHSVLSVLDYCPQLFIEMCSGALSCERIRPVLSLGLSFPSLRTEQEQLNCKAHRCWGCSTPQ